MFIFHNETTLDDLGNGVTRRILAHSGKMMAVEVNFAQGAIGPMHSHPHEQLTYVLSGEFEFTIGEESISSGPAIRSTKRHTSCTAACVFNPAPCWIPLPPYGKIFYNKKGR